MIANVSPGLSCSEHTLNTLRYADRVKELKKMKQPPINKEDQLAQLLMLPRQKSNITRVRINNYDYENQHFIRFISEKFIDRIFFSKINQLFTYEYFIIYLFCLYID